MPLLQKIGLLRNVTLPILLILGVLGSIYLGVATPSEAAGIGAAGAILCTVVRRRLTWHTLQMAVYDTMRIVGLVMWIVFGAYAFVGVYTLSGGADFVTGLLFALPLGGWGTLIVIMAILIILGTVLDVLGIIILCVPIFVPVITAFGFDPLWFGVLFVINLQIAFLSPPFGFSLFYLKGVSPPEISMMDIYRGVVPIIILQIIGLAIVMVFPQIILWLPAQMIK